MEATLIETAHPCGETQFPAQLNCRVRGHAMSRFKVRSLTAFETQAIIWIAPVCGSGGGSPGRPAPSSRSYGFRHAIGTGDGESGDAGSPYTLRIARHSVGALRASESGTPPAPKPQTQAHR